MKTIAKPQQGTYPEYFGKYIDLVKGEDLFTELYTEYTETMELITSLDDETLQYRYAPGKWNIREIVQHLVDTERIFNYRALSFSRNEQAALPGFDENAYVANSSASQRDINDLVRELSVVRAATVELYKSFTEEMLDRSGTANGKQVSVRAILFATLGHEIHHRNIIDERYLPR